VGGSFVCRLPDGHRVGLVSQSVIWCARSFDSQLLQRVSRSLQNEFEVRLQWVRTS
jgi:hypothetical protein